eukprot:109915-Pyramimonas_sp.AAC.1
MWLVFAAAVLYLEGAPVPGVGCAQLGGGLIARWVSSSLRSARCWCSGICSCCSGLRPMPPVRWLPGAECCLSIYAIPCQLFHFRSLVDGNYDD